MALGLSRKDMVMMVVLLSGTLLAMLNQMLVSPALPSIMVSLDVDATTVQWLTSAYSLTEAVIIPLSAYLIGRFPTRKLFTGCFVIFFVGSLTAALAPNFWVLLAGRVIQAICTGAVLPMVLSIILLMFPPERRGTAMGIVGLVIGFAPAVGPVVSGLLVDYVGWRWLFGIITILAGAVIVFSLVSLRNYSEFKRAPFDPLSVVLSSVGLVCLLYGVSTFTSTSNMALTVALIVVGVIILAVYVYRQLHLDEPMLRVDVLRSRKFTTDVVVVMIIQATLMGVGVIAPLYIQGVRGYSATLSGLCMLPGAIGGAILGLIAGRLFDRYGVRKVAVPAVCVMLCGALGLSLLGIDSEYVFIVVAYTLLTLGLQSTMTPLNTWGINSLDNSVIQHAQSLQNTLNQVAGSIGTALLVSISALAPTIAPTASAAEQTYLGYHMSFIAVAVLVTIALLVVIFLARDKAEETAKAPVAGGSEGSADE